MNSDLKEIQSRLNQRQSIEVPSLMLEWLKKPKPLFVGGKWKEGSRGESFFTVNPATGEKLSEVAVASEEDVNDAVKSARSAVESQRWSCLSLKERAVAVNRLGDLILEHRGPLALLESLDTGKPIRESFEGDILRAAHNFKFFAEFALNEESQCFPSTESIHFCVREPLGVVALITPWNLPLYLETWKLAPSLMMGNACVLKPSELTPLSAIYLAELFQEAGFPPGVLNVVQGFGERATGEFLAANTGVDAISFTGETSTGRAIMKSASRGPTRVSFELGGKGASIVFDDAPFDEAVKESARAAFRNQGEICLACPRIFVHENIYDAFLEAFVRETRAIRVGNPLDYDTTMGALISEDHLRKVNGYIGEAKLAGKVRFGGERPPSLTKGNFLLPTIITDLDLDHRVSREEVFGPVVSIYRFSDERKVCEAVNATPYGLSAAVWTRDLNRAHRLSRAINAGLVWVNCWFVRDLRVPFGGQKRSGVGREGGKHSLDFYSEWKSICMKTGNV